LSISAFNGRAFKRIYTTCLFLALFTFLTRTAQSQALTQPQAAAAGTTSQPAPQPQAAAAATAPRISSVAVFPQSVPQTTSAQTPKSTFVLEINGTGFDSIADMNNLRIIVFPATDGGAVQVLSRSLDNSKILAQFTAPTNYALEQVALSLTGSSFVTFSTGTSACDFETKVKLKPQIVPRNQAGNKYGNGVATNFHVIQLSIVNECSMPIVMPLAGITVVPDPPTTANPIDLKDACGETGGLVPFSLDHVTSLYSADRKLTGKRAIYFNVVQALATLGSAVEPFFAHGFTQGVAILGGGFTTASKEIMVDMSTEQLQNITSQSFGATEQISANGSVQKFAFVRRNKHKECKDSTVEANLRDGKFSVQFELVPASAQAPATQNAKATPTPR
jgi:hypothetical protein